MLLNCLALSRALGILHGTVVAVYVQSSGSSYSAVPSRFASYPQVTGLAVRPTAKKSPFNQWQGSGAEEMAYRSTTVTQIRLT